MPSLTQDERGNYRARKRLPEDVREEYGRLHGTRYEAKFFIAAGVTKQEATRRYGEWIAEVEGRLAGIRAARNGTGISLTAVQARKLAGEWYDWWTGRHANASREQLDHWRDEVHEAFRRSASEDDREHLDADALWDQEDVRAAVRPVLADVGETAQFLALKQPPLTNTARDAFLDYLYDDLAAALDLLRRRAGGDYGDDKYTDRFPRQAPGADTGITVCQLFERWVNEAQASARYGRELAVYVRQAGR